MWPWRSRPLPDDATRALELARRALAAAESGLEETERETRKINRELEVNHFGPLIFEAMMKVRPR